MEPTPLGPSALPPSIDDIAFDSAVDARGLNCPLPILKAKKALATIASGQVLKVTSTDPGSRRLPPQGPAPLVKSLLAWLEIICNTNEL